MFPRTLFLEPPEQRLRGLGQASEAEAVLQVDTEQSEGLNLRRLVEVFTVFLQPQMDDVV